ncbi:metallophosphoesterase [Fibrobacter sp.]|uniref:metallophosphoesterase n=1 Tax=Fibrobacter sp. TaxID=35828 RepID=UPI003868DC40
MLQIIHISDFHLDNKILTASKERLANAFIEDLKKQDIDFEKCILIISGDLIDKGGCGFSDIDEAFSTFESFFLNKITDTIKITRERIFFVPGNHDIDRTEANEYIEKAINEDLTDVDKVKSFIKNNRQSLKNLKPIESYKKFETKFYEKSFGKKYISNFESCFFYENIGVACLNSSWRSSIETYNLVLGRSQVDESLNFLKDADIRIAVMHHSLEDLVEFDREDVRKALYKNFDILLTGHKHKLDLSLSTNFQGTLLNCQCNASLADFSDSVYTNGYSIINFEKNSKAQIIYRKYLKDNETFVKNTDIGNDEGFICLSFPQLGDIEKKGIEEKALENVFNSKLNYVDERLFTHGLDPNIPGRLNDLFVEPVLTEKPESETTSKKEKKYHISDILSSGSNYLFLGAKESGKTTLLDKIFSELITLYRKYECLPVLLNFADVSVSKDINETIREYFAISKKEFEILKNGNQKFILIIDNVDFNDKNRIAQISEYLKNYKYSNLICSTLQVIDNYLPPVELFSSTIEFKTIYIRQFQSTQMKSLISKWFPNNDNEIKDRISLLIKNFHTLSLPRTPLSVTLFLWIINKQEATPVNNAVLVEMVVENLLEKTHYENIYQNKFTYKNKIRLLAFLAHHMENRGDYNQSYRMSYADTILFIDNYLKDKIELSAKNIIEDFVKRGILNFDSNDFIKFKYNFFFRYFLALYIDYSNEFKNHVFNEDVALNYIEELVYYSGLHTDCKELLELSQIILSKTYEKINSELLSDEKKIDKFFNDKPAISSLLNLDRIKEKPSEEVITKAYDEELSRIPIKNTIEKRCITNEKSLDKVLKLASLLFKNLEEVDDGELRKKAYKAIITSSMSMLLYYHNLIVNYYIEKQKCPENFPDNIDFSFFVRMLPYLHQVLMSDWLGTEKTKLIIKEKIEDDKKNITMSEYEKFLSVFIYADIKGRDAKDLYKDFLINNGYKYVMDMGIMKLIYYYYMQSKTNESDVFLLNLIGDLKKKIGTEKNFSKSKFIEQLRKQRQNFKRYNASSNSSINSDG